MEWIDQELDFPDEDQIICYGSGKVFICELIETKWGNYYRSKDSSHSELKSEPEWTHWMHIPKPPGK